MIKQTLTKLASALTTDEVQAHCDVPCGIYDPSSAQLAALSVLRFLNLIEELETANSSGLSVSEMATLSRLVREKEIHAESVKTQVRILWGDYFKTKHAEEHPSLFDLIHQIMQTASKCRQQTARANGELLVEQINQLSEIFWTTKGVATYTATCPYKPSVPVVYPKLD